MALPDAVRLVEEVIAVAQSFNATITKKARQ
jgi:hypothetical protein